GFVAQLREQNLKSKRAWLESTATYDWFREPSTAKCTIDYDEIQITEIVVNPYIQEVGNEKKKCAAYLQGSP
ncbi:unnamed protein product, partial [Linum tenue]